MLGLFPPSCSRTPRQSFIPVSRMACRPRTQIKSTPTCSRLLRESRLQQHKRWFATTLRGTVKLKRYENLADEEQRPKAETTEFNGRRILVTGGTKGIGAAIELRRSREVNTSSMAEQLRRSKG